MWEIKNGPIPEGMLVCHKCDNPGCVNPEHLFLGTYDDNNKDKMNKGRCNAKKNEFHPMAKLTAEQVAEIRKAKKEAAKRFWGASEYAKKYSVSLCTIFRVANGTHWKE